MKYYIPLVGLLFILFSDERKWNQRMAAIYAVQVLLAATTIAWLVNR